MAKIKLQNNRVILKNNKVSCSCCGGGCCMYPAQGFFDGLYGEADLPDNIIFTQYDLSAVINAEDRVVERSGLMYETNYGQFSQRYILLEDFEGLGPRWVFQTIVYDNEGNAATPWISLDELGCLFSQNTDGTIDGVGNTRDNFEDSYKITDPTQGEVSVFRTGGCLWEGTTDKGCFVDLLYFDSNEHRNAHKWLVIWQEFQFEYGCEAIDGGPKIGTQNTPVGDYASDTGFSASVAVP